jgi:Flp pilus assembly protein TadG
MHTPRWRRQEGLIREALYVFLAIAVIMAIFLDGVALFTTQQDARDDASDAGRAAREAYVDSSSLTQAQTAAAQHIEGQGGDMLAFSAAQVQGNMTFTVTVQHHTDTYLFKYLRYLPGLKDWVEDMENPTVTRTTS